MSASTKRISDLIRAARAKNTVKPPAPSQTGPSASMTISNQIRAIVRRLNGRSNQP